MIDHRVLRAILYEEGLDPNWIDRIIRLITERQQKGTSDG